MSSFRPLRKVGALAIGILTLFAAAAFLLPLAASGGGEDVLSSAETFESYAPGYDIGGSLGWQHGPAEIAMVTNELHYGMDTPFITDGDGPMYTNVLYVNGAPNFAARMRDGVPISPMHMPTVAISLS